MKIYLIFLILFYQHQRVTCASYTDFVSSIYNVGNAISTVFKTITNKVINLFKPKKKYEVPASITENLPTQLGILQRIKSSLNIIEPDPPEYIKLKTHPTALMSTDQLIRFHGKVPEIHQVITADGFILIVHRVMGVTSTNSTYKGTVLLHHGLLGSSADWVILGPKKSLPYLLSDIGYDVWMTNARGNYYSRNHVSLQINQTQFWNFTWQEMGTYDLPAVIDYIRKTKSNKEKINFIGHSMGTSALLVLLSTRTIYNNYIRISILLAPLAFMTNIKGPLREFAASNFAFSKEILNILEGEIFPRRKMPSVFSRHCEGPKLLCNNPLLFLTGGLKKYPLKLERGYLASLLYHVPAGGSVKTIIHYAQIAQTKKFHEYGNEHREFSLGRVTVPIALFSSNDDWLSVVSDVIMLFVNIAKPISHIVLDKQNISHTEFVWGYTAKTMVFDKIIDILDNFNPNITTLNEV